MRYLLSQTWSNIRESWGVVMQAILLMTISFFVVGAFGLLAVQVETVLERWESEAPVIVYLDEKLEAEKRPILAQEIQSWPTVKKVRVVTPKESMKRLRKSMGKHKHLLYGLDGPLLPPTLEVDVVLRARTDSHLKKLEGTLRKLKGVKNVDVGQKWFAPLWTLVAWVRGILWGGGGLLLFCACFISAGTIRMALFVHQDEIAVMRLLGATEQFIRAPFYLEGVVKGVVSAGAALLFLLAMYLSLVVPFDSQFLAFTSVHLRFFPIAYMVGSLVVGAGVGWLGSWIALRTNPTEQRVLT
ncbi:MAG: FtsX-like permease family protein [Deltaproteobacteria bacterium]|nr:MAG: FtsX-like permease family protein [Deltaproteobacteria bacterium]